jgi:hypothetical protein
MAVYPIVITKMVVFTKTYYEKSTMMEKSQYLAYVSLQYD